MATATSAEPLTVPVFKSKTPSVLVVHRCSTRLLSMCSSYAVARLGLTRVMLLPLVGPVRRGHFLYSCTAVSAARH